MSLSLSYCQLIRIVLAQMGGSPVQQIFNETSGGAQKIIKSLGIPGAAEFGEAAALAEFTQQIVAQVKLVSSEINNATVIAQQFFHNPVAEGLGTINTTIQTRIDYLSAIESKTADQTDELAHLQEVKPKLTSFLTYTNQLSGQSTGGGGFAGGCTLADLMGSGCSKSADVPDVDLQTIVDGFNSGAIITAAKDKLIKAVADGTGYTGAVAALQDLNSAVVNFNNVIENKLNEKIITAAVEQFIVGLAFDLLSGCNSKLMNAIVNPTAKAAITPFVEYQQKIRNGELPAGGVSPANTTMNT